MSLSCATVSKAFVIIPTTTIMKRARPVTASAFNDANKRVSVAASNNDLTTSTATATHTDNEPPLSPPLYLAEGLLAVHKPLTWTCNDVVSYIRGILTRDAQSRGGIPQDNNPKGGGKKKRNKPLMKVGHGGTLDPLASGVLVLGIGKGTSQLQSYLEGDKQYTAMVELGYETTTLDAEGEVVKTMDWNHVQSIDSIRQVVNSKFTGKIQQVPPLYSAIRVDGKRLYEIARNGNEKESQEVEIPMRDVEVYKVEVENILSESVMKSGVVDGKRYKEAVQEMEAAAAAAAEKAAASPPEDAQESNDDEANAGGKNKKKRKRNDNKKRTEKKSLFDETTVPTVQCDPSTGTTSFDLPLFTLNVSCGGGTYIRSLVRDIGYEMDTVATMTGLVRTKQGPFVLEDALRKEDWSADKIYEAITKIE